MVRQLIVHHKQLHFCVFMCHNIWNQKIGRQIADYSIWETLQQPVYRHCRIRDVEHQKEVLQTCWEQIGQFKTLSIALGHFRKRLSLVVAIGGGHNEHHFDYCFRCYTYIITLTRFIIQIQNLDNKSKYSGLYCATLYITGI